MSPFERNIPYGRRVDGLRSGDYGDENGGRRSSESACEVGYSLQFSAEPKLDVSTAASSSRELGAAHREASWAVGVCGEQRLERHGVDEEENGGVGSRRLGTEEKATEVGGACGSDGERRCGRGSRSLVARVGLSKRGVSWQPRRRARVCTEVCDVECTGGGAVSRWRRWSRRWRVRSTEMAEETGEKAAAGVRLGCVRCEAEVRELVAELGGDEAGYGGVVLRRGFELTASTGLLWRLVVEFETHRRRRCG